MSINREIKEILQEFYKLELINSNDKEQIDEKSISNTYNLANAAAIELYYLCIEDEQDAEKLSLKCSQKFSLSLTLKQSVAQAPLIASCIQILGKLVLKYKNLSKISTQYLNDFLMDPSPILLVLYKNTLKHTSNNGALNDDKILTIKKNNYIFEYIRNTALECLSMSLLACFELDSQCIKALYTKLSGCLYAVDSLDKKSQLISLNCVLALGKIATNLNKIKGTQEDILQIYHQKLCASSYSNKEAVSPLDSLIIEQLVCMLSSCTSSVYQNILSILISIIDKSKFITNNLNERNRVDLKREDISDVILSEFEKLALCLINETYLNDLLVRLLELFSQFGIKVKSILESVPRSAYKNSYAVINLGKLLPIIALLTQRISTKHIQDSPQVSKLHKLFRDFWFFCVIFGYTEQVPSDESITWYKDTCAIAARSPLLISHEHLRSELNFNSAITNDQITPTELNESRAILMTSFEQPEAHSVIKYLTFIQCSYVQTVLRLETLRILTQINAQSFQGIFQYLEDTTIQKDKANIWTCVYYASMKLFKTYLEVTSGLPKNQQRDEDIENQFQFLLVKFNHSNDKIRNLADTFLIMITKKFPHVIWSERILSCVMNITEILASSLQMNVNQVAPEFAIPDTCFKLRVVDTLIGREAMHKDFLTQGTRIIKEALTFSPIQTKSHLQNYMLNLQKNGGNIYDHSGVNMVLDIVMQHSKQPKSDSLDATSTLDRCDKRNFSAFVGQMNEKYYYVGIIQSMLEISSAHKVVEHLTKELSVNTNEKKCYEIMLKLTAFMTLTNDFDRHILHELSVCIIRKFTKQIVQVAIECWSWISSAKRKVNSLVFEEMINVWQMSVDLRLGMFSATQLEPDPLAPEENEELRPCVPNVDAHRDLLYYFQERLETARTNSELEIELFLQMMHKSLVSSLDSRESSINRHVSVVGIRFKFLTMAFSLLQYDFIQNSICKMMLRERIYYAAFCYFTTSPRVPTQCTCDLREDIKSILEFWHKLIAEKKYLKEDNFSNSNHNNNELSPVDAMSISGDYFDNSSSIHTNGHTFNQSNQNLTLQKYAESTTISKNQTMSSIKRLNAHSNGTPLPTTNSKHTLSDSSNIFKYFKDYWNKRSLLMSLLSHELDHLYSFYNPFNLQSLQIDRLNNALTRLKENISDKKWIELTQIAWSITPSLAIFLACRFPFDPVRREVQRLVKSSPECVTHVPQAVQFLATEENIQNDSAELLHLLTWTRVSPLIALGYFGKGSKGQSLAHPITAQFASKMLMISKPETLLLYIQQIVQSLRYDNYGYVREVIIWLAKHSQLLAHQLIWNMMTNVYRDQDSKLRDTQIGDILESLIEEIKSNLSGSEKIFFKREFDFFNEITNVSAKIKVYPLGPERRKACEEELKKIQLVSNCYLPSNPEAIVCEILDGRPMQSAAKAPYLARFKVQPVKLSDLESMGKSGGELSENKESQYVCACIFKVGDDVRQDMLALQIMNILKNVFLQEGLELFLFPYRVIATQPGCGVIECVPNSQSRDEIGRQTDVDLLQYFINTYGDVNTPEFQKARRNFITSLAGYSLFMYLLQVKDRHNGNLMLDKDGHLIHIDFGFMFESSPGGNMGWESDMKISFEMGLIMGSDCNSQSFLWFTEMCTKGFLALRPYREQICTLVSLLLDTGLPCFRKRAVEALRERFVPKMHDRAAAEYIQSVIRRSYENIRNSSYDALQNFQNNIYYAKK